MIRSMTAIAVSAAALAAVASNAFAGDTKGAPVQSKQNQWQGQVDLKIVDRQAAQQAGQAGQAGQGKGQKAKNTTWNGQAQVQIVRQAVKSSQQGKSDLKYDYTLQIEGELKAAKKDSVSFDHSQTYQSQSQSQSFEIALEGTDKLLLGRFMASEGSAEPMLELALVREGNLTPDSWIEVELEEQD